MRCLVFSLWMALLGLACVARAQEPAWFYDGSHRYLKLTLDGAKTVLIEVRTVGQPGEVSRWNADGEKEEKDYVFARSVGDGESRGTYYLGSGGDTSFRVKLRPDREKEKPEKGAKVAKPQDEGVVGLYIRLTEERRLALAKREAEAAEKRLAEVIKAQGKRWPSVEKPALNEWRARWPGLRDRTLALHVKPKAMTAGASAGAKPGAGSGGLGGLGASGSVEDRRPERWFELSELAGQAMGYLAQGLDPKTKDGWEGEFNDGFGGTVQVTQDAKDGLIHFTLNYARGNDEQNGMLTGKSVLRTDESGPYVDFQERDPKVEDPAKQTHVRLRLLGHYLVVDTQNIGKYTTRGWFEGVYRKGPPPQE